MTKKEKKFTPWPYFGKEEIEAAERVLRSGKVNQWTGNEVFSFEKEYARSLGVRYAIAVVNGSVALDMALSVLGIGKGDEVIVPARSFVATASCVALRGAVPVFADVDLDSQNITLEAIEPLLTKRTRAVICVHLAGWPCRMDELRTFCDKHKLFLIEDCAQAHAAKFKNKPVGSFGDISCFSFCQDKIITTAGEGGLLCTDREALWKKAWSLKDHGRDPRFMSGKKSSNGFLWSVASFGSNYRMTEVQAAVGRVMLRKLDAWVAKRRALARILTRGFSQIAGLRVTEPSKDEYHSYYKYYVFLELRSLRKGWNRQRIIASLQQRGVPCGTGVCPELYLEKAFVEYYKLLGRKPVIRLANAKQLSGTSLMFLVHPTLTPANMHYVVRQVDTVMRLATS